MRACDCGASIVSWVAMRTVGSANCFNDNNTNILLIVLRLDTHQQIMDDEHCSWITRNTIIAKATTKGLLS
jgi:hypothetical protein